jgi:hypothetical protein
MPSLITSTAIDDIFKSLGGNRLKIVVVNKVSMLNTEFLVLLDTRLQSMYNLDRLFGGISILLIGDFILLLLTTGHNLWSVMYGTVNGKDATAQDLFQHFHVHELMANIRAADCVIHMQRVAAFRALPLVYPTRQKWSAKDNAHYKPITQDILDGVTYELTSQDIEKDPNWITHSTYIIISNVDRAIINSAAAKDFGNRKNVPVLQWKCQLHEDFPLSSQAILYNEDKRPELFSFFCSGRSWPSSQQCSWQCLLWCCKWHSMYNAFIGMG